LSLRRFTRLTNAFSKKAANLNRALALHFVYQHFCRKHGSLKTTLTIKAGLTDHIWALHEIVSMADDLR